jgi:hypothetical protein
MGDAWGGKALGFELAAFVRRQGVDPCPVFALVGGILGGLAFGVVVGVHGLPPFTPDQSPLSRLNRIVPRLRAHPNSFSASSKVIPKPSTKNRSTWLACGR